MLSTLELSAPQRSAPERIRRAEAGDIPAITELIDTSIYGLGTAGYTRRQIVSALLYVSHLDPRLITDGTYYVAEAGSQIVGAGGWTRRHAPFGAVRHEHAAGYEQWLAAVDNAARIRAVYVHPDWTRQGIGRRLVGISERAAQHAGFTELALLASVAGVPLYRACGYQAAAQLDLVLPDGTNLPTVPMSKRLGALGVATPSSDWPRRTAENEWESARRTPAS